MHQGPVFVGSTIRAVYLSDTTERGHRSQLKASVQCKDLASGRTHCLLPFDTLFLARSTLLWRNPENFFCFFSRSAEKRGADVDFQAVRAHVSNQELQVSSRGASDWWRVGPKVCLGPPGQKSGISNTILAECGGQPCKTSGLSRHVETYVQHFTAEAVARVVLRVSIVWNACSNFGSFKIDGVAPQNGSNVKKMLESSSPYSGKGPSVFLCMSRCFTFSSVNVALQQVPSVPFHQHSVAQSARQLNNPADDR